MDTDRARAAAARSSRIFLQEWVKTSIRARKTAEERAKACKERLKSTLFEDDMVKVESICQGTANKVFQKFKERQRSTFESLH